MTRYSLEMYVLRTKQKPEDALPVRDLSNKLNLFDDEIIGDKKCVFVSYDDIPPEKMRLMKATLRDTISNDMSSSVVGFGTRYELTIREK